MHDPHTLSPHAHISHLCKLACIKTHTATRGHDFKAQSALKLSAEPPQVLYFT